MSKGTILKHPCGLLECLLKSEQLFIDFRTVQMKPTIHRRTIDSEYINRLGNYFLLQLGR